MDFETRAIHVGQEPDPATGRDHHADLPDVDLRPGGGRRPQGLRLLARREPDAQALQEALASLEDAKHGVAFSSGIGATTTLMHLVDPGERVVLIADVYGGVYRMTSQVYEPKGYRFTYVPAERVRRQPRGVPRRRRAHGLGRDAVEPAAERRRHPQGRRRVARRRRDARRRQHVRDAVPPAAARRSAPTPSSTRRRSTSAATATRSAASSRRTTTRSPSGSTSSRSRSARCRARSTPGSCCAGSRRSPCACASTARTRAASRSSSTATPAVERVLYPGLPSHPEPRGRTRARCATSAAWSRSSPSRGGGARPGRAHEALPARRVARRRREPDRAPGADDPRVDRRRAVRAAAEPRAPLGRDRVGRRPARRPRGRAGQTGCDRAA